MEGKTYAGWGAPSEEAVIKPVIDKSRLLILVKLNIVGSDGSGIAGLSDEVGKNKVNTDGNSMVGLLLKSTTRWI